MIKMIIFSYASVMPNADSIFSMISRHYIREPKSHSPSFL